MERRRLDPGEKERRGREGLFSSLDGCGGGVEAGGGGVDTAGISLVVG